METVLPTMRVPEMGDFLSFQVFGARPTALPSNLAYTDRANTFTVGPQTLQADADGLDVKPTSSGKFGLRVYNSSGTLQFSVTCDTGAVFTNAEFSSAVGYRVTAFGAYVGVLASDRIEFYNGHIDLFTTSSTGVQFRQSDSATTTVSSGLTLRHATSGTPGVGFGTSLRVQLDSSTTADRDAAKAEVFWTVATDATRKVAWVDYVYDTAAREVIRRESDGTQALLGFFGGGPFGAAARPSGDVSSALETLGLITSPDYSGGFGNAALASDAVTTSSAMSDTGLSVPLANGQTWSAEFHLLVTGPAGGVKFDAAITGGGTVVRVFTLGNTTAVTALSSDNQAAAGTATQAYCAGVTGIVLVRMVATGTTFSTAIKLRFASAVNTETSTILAGSHVTGRRVS